MRWPLIVWCVCAAGSLIPAAASVAGRPVTQPLNPPPPAWQTCKAVGNGTICEGTQVESFGPIDTSEEGTPIICGSGSSAFDVFDTATDEFRIRKVFDENGNLVRRWFHDHYTFGEYSNPLTGATVSYTQTDTRTEVFAVPGDVSSATTTTTWEIVFHSAGGAPVLRNTGRTIVAPDGTTVFRAGRLGFWDLFEDGDTSVLEPLCTALAGE